MARSRRSPQQAVVINLETRLAELLEQRRDRSERWFAIRTVDGKIPNPFGKPQPRFSFPDPYPPGATKRKLDEFSRRTGIELPTSLRKWLSITNGAAGFFGVKTRSKQNSIEAELELWPEMKQRGWIPVAFDAHGNRYVQLVCDGASTLEPVCYVEMADDSISHVVASDMLHFAVFLLEEELADGSSPWPFDKEYTVARDPAMLEFAKLPLPSPWDD